MNQVIEFLELNGFKKQAKNAYWLNNCTVYIHKNHYEVFSDGRIWYSNDLTIYTLIGYLTYYGIMDKQYKQL